MLDLGPYERDLLIYAFRYALGRASYSVSTVAEVIVANWGELSQGDKDLYKREIQEAIDNSMYGMDMDKNTWETILALP